MKSKMHRISAALAVLCIGTFFTSTIFVEVFCSKDAITTVKSLIVMPGLLILIPAIAIAGGSGFSMTKSRKGLLVKRKKRRMPIISSIGILILIPAAIVLDTWASDGSFDTTFYILQIIEIIAGGINLTMMGLNMRDGLVLSGRLRSKKAVENSLHYSR